MCTQINFNQVYPGSFYPLSSPFCPFLSLPAPPPKPPVNPPFSDNSYVKNTIILYYYGIFFILSTIGIYGGYFTFVNFFVYSMSLACVPSTGSSSFSPHRSHSYPPQPPPSQNCAKSTHNSPNKFDTSFDIPPKILSTTSNYKLSDNSKIS